MESIFKKEDKMTKEQMVKVGALVVGGITAIVLVTTHPIISALIAIAGVAFYLIDSGKVNL
jgi:hypothetical protein